jgi:hypothetical protein
MVSAAIWSGMLRLFVPSLPHPLSKYIATTCSYFLRFGKSIYHDIHELNQVSTKTKFMKIVSMAYGFKCHNYVSYQNTSRTDQTLSWPPSKNQNVRRGQWESGGLMHACMPACIYCAQRLWLAAATALFVGFKLCLLGFGWNLPDKFVSLFTTFFIQTQSSYMLNAGWY